LPAAKVRVELVNVFSSQVSSHLFRVKVTILAIASPQQKI
jgi:hypothetical protein